jgi:hypothetical protein
MYTHSHDPSKQYAILRKIRGSRDQAIPGYFAPQEQIPWVRGWTETGCSDWTYRVNNVITPSSIPSSDVYLKCPWVAKLTVNVEKSEGLALFPKWWLLQN